MKKLLIIVIISIWTSVVFADIEYDFYTVIAESGLVIRSEANLNGKILATIPFGISIKKYHSKSIPDTINDRTENWEFVEYNGITGYVWGLYISRYKFFNKNDSLNNYRIIKEGEICGTITYSPEYYWYGIYSSKTRGTQELRPVKITILFPKVLDKEDRKRNFGTEYFEEGRMFLIKTDQEQKSDFLIGSKTKLETGYLEGYTFSRYSKNPWPVFIYPEQPKIFELKNGSAVTFISRDIPMIVDSSKFQLSSRYSLMILQGKQNYTSATRYNHFVNLNPKLEFMHAPAMRHAGLKNPTILWYGDIDNDKKPDFIIHTNNMVEHGGIEMYNILFLSGEAGETEILKKQAFFHFWGCYG